MSINPGRVTAAMAARAHDLGLVHYQPAGVTPDNLTIPLATFGGLPGDVTLSASFTHYNTAIENDDSLQLDNPLVYIQVRFRESGDNPTAVTDRAHAFFEAMHTESPGPWPGGVTPVWCLRTVTAPAEYDNGSWSKADSYEIRCNP